LIGVAVLGAAFGSCHPLPSRSPVAKSGSTATPELSPAARLARGKQRLELSAYREAETDFRALLSTSAATPARVALAQVLVATGRYSEAVSSLAPLIADSTWV